MFDLNKIHEKEEFSLILSKRINGKQVILFFKSLGLSFEDDFFYLNRNEPEVPWQSLSIVTIESFLGEVQVYPDESMVDSFKFIYLFASLPESCFNSFKDLISQGFSHFGGKLVYKQRQISLMDLDALFVQWKNDLKDEAAEQPGTESLAIFIQEYFYQ